MKKRNGTQEPDYRLYNCFEIRKNGAVFRVEIYLPETGTGSLKGRLLRLMENELKNLPPEVEKTVFAMHVKPFEMIFNNNVAKVFQLYVNQFPNVQFCLYGHEHQLTVDDLFGDGVLYYQCPCIDKRTYLLFTIKEDGSYDYEAIKF